MPLKPLIELKSNESGVIREVKGGRGLKTRLENMGLRNGQKITKLSAQFWKGPVTVQTGRSKVAIGHGMAAKIMIEV